VRARRSDISIRIHSVFLIRIVVVTIVFGRLWGAAFSDEGAQVLAAQLVAAGVECGGGGGHGVRAAQASEEGAKALASGVLVKHHVRGVAAAPAGGGSQPRCGGGGEAERSRTQCAAVAGQIRAGKSANGK
jgi:hypothetical protein